MKCRTTEEGEGEETIRRSYNHDPKQMRGSCLACSPWRDDLIRKALTSALNILLVHTPPTSSAVRKTRDKGVDIDHVDLKFCTCHGGLPI